MKKNVSNVLWGVILILLGVYFAGRAFDWFDFNIFFDGFWSLIIIVPSFIGLFNRDSDKTGCLIGLFLGTLFLLASQDVIRWSMFPPLLFGGILFVIGLRMIIPRKKSTTYKFEYRQQDQNTTYQYTSSNYKGENDKEESFNQAEYEEAKKTWTDNSGTSNVTRASGEPIACTAILTGRELRFDNEVFPGAMLSATLGGIDLDLRNAIIRENVVIEARVLLGGIDIYVPSYVRVVVNCTPILGGVDNLTTGQNNMDEKTVTIYLNGTCVLGGIDVK